jgi:hypothetical protein
MRRRRLSTDRCDPSADASQLIGDVRARRAATQMRSNLTARIRIKFLIQVGSDQVSRPVTLHRFRLS